MRLAQILWEARANPVEPPTDPAFHAWFAGSRCVDAHGAPLPLFHGTDKRFRKFRDDKIGTGLDADPFVGGVGFLGKGFYFTPARHKADSYGSRTVVAYLALKHPLVVGKRAQWDSIHTAMAAINGHDDTPRREFRDVLVAHGYDGIIKHDLFYPELDEYVAFKPDQIRMN